MLGCVYVRVTVAPLWNERRLCWALLSAATSVVSKLDSIIGRPSFRKKALGWFV